VDDKIRNEIERRFKNSQTNDVYKFPRKEANEKRAKHKHSVSLGGPGAARVAIVPNLQRPMSRGRLIKKSASPDIGRKLALRPQMSNANSFLLNRG
jgi:hypothetical protein